MMDVFAGGSEPNDIIADTFCKLRDAGLIQTSADYIAYTNWFEDICIVVRDAGYPLSENEVYRRLINLRKNGRAKAPEIRRAKLKPIIVNDWEVGEYACHVYEMLDVAGIVSLSMDQIAYTHDFESLYFRVIKHFEGLDRNQVFSRMMNARKQGKLHAPNGRVKVAEGHPLLKDL